MEEDSEILEKRQSKYKHTIYKNQLHNTTRYSFANSMWSEIVPSTMNLTEYSNSANTNTNTNTCNEKNSTLIQNDKPNALGHTSLKEMLKKQEEKQSLINSAHSQMHAINMMMHYSQFKRTQKLEEETSLLKSSIGEGWKIMMRLKEKIQSHDAQLQEIEEDVASLTHTSEDHKQQFEQLSKNIAAKEEVLHDQLSQFDNKLTGLNHMLQKQTQQVEKLLSVRFRMDFGVDALIILLSFYASRTGIVSMIIRFVASFKKIPEFDYAARIRHQHKLSNIISVARLVLFILLVRKLRSLVVRSGLHSREGTFSRYGAEAFRMLQNGVGIVLGGHDAFWHNANELILRNN